MNRREFITSVALALPTLQLLGTSSVKTYRSDKSIFTNQELTKWCARNGGHYAQDDELVWASYQSFYTNKSGINPNAYKTPTNSFRHTIFGIPSNCDKYEALNLWLIQFRHPCSKYRFIIKDIFYPEYVIDNVKMMPLIAFTREYSGYKYYGPSSPVFDIKTHRYMIPTYDEINRETIIYTGFKFV